MTATFEILDFDGLPEPVISALDRAGAEFTKLVLHGTIACFDGRKWQESEHDWPVDVDPDDIATFRDGGETPLFTLLVIEDLDIAGIERLVVELALQVPVGGNILTIGRELLRVEPPTATPRTRLVFLLSLPDASDADDPSRPQVGDLFGHASELVWRLGVIPQPRGGLGLEHIDGPWPGTWFLDGTPGERHAEPPDKWSYRPQADNTLVLRSQEWHIPSVPLVNWRRWDIADDEERLRPLPAPYHRPRLHSDRAPGIAVTTVVFHETGRSPPLQPYEAPTSWDLNRDLGIHLRVMPDGSAVQFYDIAQPIRHTQDSDVNDRGVGIELANELFPSELTGVDDVTILNEFPPWEGQTSVRRYPHPEGYGGNEARPLVRLFGGEWAILPTLRALESAFQLVVNLAQLGINPNPFGQLVFPPIIVADFDDIEGFLASAWPTETRPLHGLLAHSNIDPGRVDGLTPTLYCWLRSNSIVASQGSAAAHRALLTLLSNTLQIRRCSDGRRRYFLDVGRFAKLIR